jgi:hypothetical protein
MRIVFLRDKYLRCLLRYEWLLLLLFHQHLSLTLSPRSFPPANYNRNNYAEKCSGYEDDDGEDTGPAVDGDVGAAG